VTTAEKYVAAAYAVFLVALLVYVAIISLKLARLEREVGELAILARARITSKQEGQPPQVHHG
jgi:hypothetical protein